jgi:tRNA (guanine-N7-)-methyltransferase
VVPLWSHVFGNERPVEIEIGPGRGDVLAAFAGARPDVNFFAIEHARGAAEALARRLAAAGLANARVICGDAPCVLHRLVPAASVAAYHVYFPDPWPKRRHAKRRLFSDVFVGDLERTLVPGGIVHVATDLAWLFDEIAAVLRQNGFVERAATLAPDRPTTKFERKYAQAGTYRAAFGSAGGR